MALPYPIFNLFDEWNTLNSNLVDTGGIWQLVNAPVLPVHICVSDDGITYGDVSVNVNDQIGTVHNPYIDASGTECATAPLDEGEYIFKYSFLGSCPDEGLFTITVNAGDASITFSRVNNACLYEILTENPITGTNEANFLTIPQDNVTLPFSMRVKVLRRELENCTGGATTLQNTVYNFSNLDRNTLTLGNVKQPGQGLDPRFTGKIYYFHRIEVDYSSWQTGAGITDFRLHQNGGGSSSTIDLELTTTYTSGNATAYCAALQLEIGAALIALDADSSSCQFKVFNNNIDNYVTIDFVCCHDPYSNYGTNFYWIGIDKNDWYAEYCIDVGDCNYNHTNGVVNFLQGVSFNNIFNDGYCYTLTNLAFYQTLANYTICVYPILCFPAAGISFDEIIVDFDNSNYDEINLIVGAKPNILDYDEVICAA